MKNITSKQISLIGIIACCIWLASWLFPTVKMILPSEDAFEMKHFVYAIVRGFLMLGLLVVIIMEYTNKHNKNAILLCLIFAGFSIIASPIIQVIEIQAIIKPNDSISIWDWDWISMFIPELFKLLVNLSLFVYMYFFYKNGQRSTIKEIRSMQNATIIAIIGVSLQLTLTILALGSVSIAYIYNKLDIQYGILTNMIVPTIVMILLLAYFILNLNYYKAKIREYSPECKNVLDFTAPE